MGGVLGGAGFQVFECDASPQLEGALRLLPLRSQPLLLVLCLRLAAPCVAAIGAVARERSRRLQPLLHVVWILEFGTGSAIALPDAGPCSSAVLEKPFDLQHLHDAAVRCLRTQAYHARA